MPAAISDFVGRADALDRLDALLPADDAVLPEVAVISAIAGAAGIGKTSLAVHWAHRVSHRFPDGQLYVNLRGFDPAGQVTDSADVLHGFLEALGTPVERMPSDPDSRAGLYRSLLAGKRVLVILDNARDANQVRPLLPGSAGCLALVTSRNQLFSLVVSEAATLITVDLLTPSEARQLLEARIGAERVTREPDATGEIIARCSGFPLALAIVAARAVLRSNLRLEALAEELHEARGRLDALSEDDPASDLRSVFSWSYRTLTPEAARLFRLLSLHPGQTMTSSAAATLTALPRPDVSTLILELVRANLLVPESRDRLRFHDLIRVYAVDLAYEHDSEHQRLAAGHRILDWYLNSTIQAARLIRPSSRQTEVFPVHGDLTLESIIDDSAALGFLAAERGALPQVLSQMADAERHTAVVLLTQAVSTFLVWQGHWPDLAVTAQAGLTAAIHLDDRRAQAQARHGLALALRGIGRVIEAEQQLDASWQLYDEIDDPAGKASVYRELSHIMSFQRDDAGALKHAQLAHESFQLAGHEEERLAALNDVAWFLAIQGRYREAFTAILEVRRHHQRQDDRSLHAAAVLNSLGYILRHLGHCQFAVACYLQALDLQIKFGARFHQAHTLNDLGDAYYAVQDRKAAAATWRRAAAIFDDLGHPDGTAVRAKLSSSTDRTDAPTGLAPRGQ
ncbi:NB-ARC domain-containing protein [Kribbella sp. NBC_01505]|uniref:ATP-binding protein n=1 Tax=Kribbella sp. NBC_01505 TaxID=2903580 RepID=UPI003866B4B9